jgi:DNA-binding CsgD family transcriptional regulator/PAS domain-containing protein
MTKSGNRLDVPLETFSEVVESIYDCALDPSQWPETLNRIVGLCQSQFSTIGIVDLKHERDELTYQVGLKESDLKSWGKYAHMNPYVAPLQLVPVGTVVTSAMLIDDHELLESRYSREFLKPLGILDIIGFNVLKTEHRVGLLSAIRTESQGRYGEAEIRLLTLLSPHVCRSVAISDALNLKTVKSEALEATLDALASGVYLTDRESRIVYLNRAAERQVKAGNALRIVNHHLSPIDRVAHTALAKAIAEATTDETETPSGGITVALPGDDNTGLVATILPLNRGERRNLCGTFAATAAIFVQDPVVVPPLPGEAFAKLHGLTGSELRVLLAMSPGLSVKEAAEMLGISDTTAKTHLQKIYAKTGTSKQTELMNLFVSSAPPVKTTTA